mgnify:CR=1 FL=1
MTESCAPDFLDDLFGSGAVYTETVAETPAEAIAEAPVAQLKPCPKCCGSGRIDAFVYYKGGSCFRCCGTGIA